MSNESQGKTQDWAGAEGEKWLSKIDRFESMLAKIGDALLKAAAIRPGDEVLDVGCGGGPTSLRLAGLVGPKGHVTGLDISPALVETATARARDAGLTNIDFICADGAKAALPQGRYDLLFSRFGVMFFEDPPAAFANLRKALKPGGRTFFACWATVEDNPWVQASMGTFARHIDMPKRDPRAPGPLAFGDLTYTEDVLTKAGFTEFSATGFESLQPIGGAGATAVEATDFVMDSVLSNMVLAGQDEATRAAIRADLLSQFEKVQTPDGVVLGSKAWFVSARAG